MKHAAVRDNGGLFFSELIDQNADLCPCVLIHRCCECGASLSHWYYEKDNRLFCKKDYWAKFGQLCHGCSEPITTGLIMVSPNRPKPNLCRLSSPHSPAVHPSVLQFLTAAPVTHHSLPMLHSHSHCCRITREQINSTPVCVHERAAIYNSDAVFMKGVFVWPVVLMHSLLAVLFSVSTRARAVYLTRIIYDCLNSFIVPESSC